MAKSLKSIKAGWVNSNSNEYGAKKYTGRKPTDSLKDIDISKYDFGVDKDYIDSFYKDYDNYFNKIKSDYDGVTYNNASDMYDKYSKSGTNLRDRATTIKAYLNSRKGTIDAEQYDSFMSVFDSIDKAYEGNTSMFREKKDFYSQFKTEDDYKAYENEKKRREKMATDDLTLVQTEIDDLEGKLKKAEEINSNIHYGATTRANAQEIAAKNSKYSKELKDLLSSYGYKSIDELRNAVSDRKFYKDEAQKVQDEIALDKKHSEMAVSEEGKLGWEKWLEYDKQRKAKAGETSALEENIIRGFTTASDNPLSVAFNNVAYDKRKDTSYQEPQEDWTEEEKNIWGAYFYEGGYESAANYAAKLNNEKATEEKNKQKKKIEDSALSSGWGAVGNWVGSIMTAPFGLADYLDDLTDIAAGRDTIVQEDVVTPFEYSQTVQESQASALNEWSGTLDERIPIIGGKGLGDVYGLVTSQVLSKSLARVMGPVGVLISYFGQGAAANTDDAISRGASAGQAALYGGAIGLADAIPEAISADKFLKLGKTKKGFFNALRKQAREEGREELFTALLSNAADNAIMQDKSHFNEKVRQYRLDGLSEGKAKSQAWLDTADEVAYDTLSGYISGGFGSVGQVTRAYTVANKENKAKGQNIRSNEHVSDMLEVASLTPKESEAYEEYTKYAKKGITADNISDKQLGKLYRTVYTEAVETLDDSSSTAEEKTNAKKVLNDLATYSQENSIKRIGKKNIKKIYGNENTDYLIAEGLDNGKDTESYKLAEEYKNKIDNGEKITTEEIAQLVDANQTAYKDSVLADATAKLNEHGAVTAAENIAEIIAKKTVGERLTTAENEVLESSEYGNLVYNEINHGELVDNATNMEKEEANLYISLYDGKTSVDRYTTQYELVKSYAKNRFPVNYMLEHRGVLSPKAVQAIDKMFATGKDNTHQKTIADLKQKHKDAPFIYGAFDDSVIDYENNNTKGKANWNSLTSSQRNAIVLLSGVSQQAGMDVELILDGEERGLNGAYSISGNKILIDVYAGMEKVDLANLHNLILPTFSHEMTHWMKDKSPVLYRKYGDYVIETIKIATGMTEEQILARRRKRMEANHPGEVFSDEEVRDEVIARASEDMFGQSKEIRKFVDTLTDTEKKTFVDKVKEILQKLKDWFETYITKNLSNAPEAQDIRKVPERIQEQIDMWDKMLVDSISANQALKHEGVTGEELANKPTKNSVQEMARENTNIDKYGFRQDNVSRANKQGELINDYYYALSKGEWRTFYDEITNNGYLATAIVGTVAPIRVNDKLIIAERLYTGKDAHDYTVLDAFQLKEAYDGGESLDLLEKKIRLGELIYDRQTVYRNISQILKRNQSAGILTRFDANSQRYVFGDTYGIDGKNNESVYGDSQKGIAGEGLSLRDKSSVQGNDELQINSDRDTLGNTLTETQQTYFADSKVRDENGNLKVMYHGSPNADFTIFKSGTYFTEHKWYADNYQNQGASSLSYKKTANKPDTYAVYLNIKKPFDTRNKKERDIFYNEYFQQWGTGTDLMESGLPDWLDGQDLQEFLEEKGYDYDGLILDEGATGGYGEEVISRGFSYVIFNPEQVKSVENKTPTNNPDYRFSDRDNAYMDAVNAGDMETAQRLVDEAAKANGYKITGYHGTDIRFTIFDREKTSTSNDFGKGFYFTSSQVEAQKYQNDDTFGDTYNKIDGIAYDNALERIYSMGEDASDDALFTKLYNEEFDKELKRRTDEGAIINAYLKMEKPFIVSTTNWITEEEAIDIAKNTMYVDNVPDEVAISDWVHSIKSYAKQHDGKVDTHQFANNMGHSVNLTSALLTQGIYDGILDYSVGTKFNSTADYHAIALYPNKIKDSAPITYDNNGNVIPLSERFNTTNEDIRYSDRDSEGKTLSKGQQQFFKDSKVRDDNGNLMVVYHSTNADFTVFKDEFIGTGAGNSFGNGFYFASDKIDEYGKSKPYYLNINNPYIINLSENRFAKENELSEVIKFASFFGVNDEEVKNWHKYYSGYVNQAKATISKILDEADANDLSNLKELGYDGLIINNAIVGIDNKLMTTEFVAFNSNQAKLTTNKTPTTDPDIRYSERDNVSVYDLMGETDRLIKENEKLKADVERLKERLKLEKQVTHGNYFNRNQLDAVAGHICSIANSDYAKKDLVALIDKVYSYIAHSPDLNWQDLYAQCYDVARMVLAEARPMTETNDYYKFVLKDIRGKKISVNEQQIQNAKYRLGNKWRNAFFNKVNITNNATSLDSQWQEWSMSYPDLFDAEISDADMLVELYDIYDSLREGYETVIEYDMEEQTRWLAKEIYNQYWNVSPIRTTADKYDKQIKLLNFEHRRIMKEFRDSYEEKLKNQHKVDKEKAQKLIKEIRDRKDKEIAEVKRLGKERMDAYKERAERKTKIQSITANALTLNKWLTKNSKDEHIHEAMKGPVINLLQAINFSSKQLLGMKGSVIDKRGTPTQTDISLSKALSKVKDMMMDASVGKEELVSLYGHDLNDEIKSLVESVDNIMRSVGDNEFVLNQMSLDELITLDKIVTTIKQAVTKMNKFHTVNHAKGIANLSQEEIIYANSLGKSKVFDPQTMKAKARKLLSWDNAVPYYAFKRYGEAGKKIFEAFQDGWDKLSFHAKEIIDFAKETYSEKEIKEWSKDIKSFDVLMPTTDADLSDPNYKPKYQKVQMNVPQIMSLYCLNKREQAKGHILGGGIRIADIRLKNGELIQQSEGAILTEDDIKKITNTLTDEQKKVADALQEFMNTVCSDWGNEVSMARFGYLAFGEENYFPIQSDNNNLAVPDETQRSNDLFKLLNMSFTKGLTDGANNRIVISDIFDVFAQHSSDMAKYNALALPVLDAFRWYNYTEKAQQGNTQFITMSVKQSIENAFGKEGQNYITNFLKDINGQKNVGRDTLGKGFFSNAKIASVAMNLRVALLQPTAYLKAGAVMKNKYLTKAFLHKPKIKHAEKYCGIALWKSLGYYDTDISKGLTEKIKHAETWKDKAVEISLKGAEWGDKITFGYLWNACELEIRDTRKDLKVGSDEFFNAIGKRLREVIYATQVVDSTVTRSQIMRSGNMYEKMLTTFSSEPTLAYNMLQDVYMQWKLEKRANGKMSKETLKKFAKVFTAYTVTNIVAALIESGFDAFRDDEDEEKDMVEFMKLYLSNFAMDMSITAKVPYIKELVSILQGFSSSRSDTQWMQSFSYAIKGMWKITVEGKGDPVAAIKNLLMSISYVSGLPFYNAYRDLMATLNKLDILTAEELEELLDELFS